MIRLSLFLLPLFQAWENLSITRAYTIKDALIHERITITAKHSSPRPQDTYIFTAPLNERVGHIHATYSGTPLHTTEVDLGEYTLKFPAPVSKDETRKFEVYLILGHALKAVPAKTQILEPNAVEFAFSLVPNSHYPTRAQEISVSGFGQLLSYAPSFFTVHGNFLSAKIVESEISSQQISGVVHFMHGSNLNFVASAVREVHVSHFGGISISDHFEVKNEAAKLHGEFSRIPFSVRDQMGDKSPFKVDGYAETLGAIFSKHAYNIHYYDVIGNISTSVAKRAASERYISAELGPRFPLLGGWRTEFSLSHVLPTKKAVGYEGEKFTLTFPFNHPLVKYFTDSLEFEVLLPEGAYDVEISAPRKISQDKITYRRDWLDTPLVGGHTVLRFRATSPFLIPEKEALNYKLTISYRLSFFAHVRPALLLVFYALVAFASLGLIARLTTGEPLPDSSPATPSGGTPTAAVSRGSSSALGSPGFVVIQPQAAGLKKRK